MRSSITSWNEKMKGQHLQKAEESQSIDITALALTPMHDRLTFERAQAVEEKMDKGSVKSHQGWMAEVKQVAAKHESCKEHEPSTSSTVRDRSSPLTRCVWTRLA
jgi:hypothetical protein